MNKQEQEVLDNFRKLTPENRVIAQSNVSIALAVQENASKQKRHRAAKKKTQRKVAI
ncbi:MAG: hypothetical protein LBQ89_07850 [Treponema sp.]|nr:hypothetical protein [Treponema sp.]